MTLDLIDFLIVKSRERAKFLGVSLLDTNKTILVSSFDIANNSVHIVNVLGGSIGWFGWCRWLFWLRLGRVDVMRLIVVGIVIFVDDIIVVDVLVEEVLLLINEIPKLIIWASSV